MISRKNTIIGAYFNKKDITLFNLIEGQVFMEVFKDINFASKDTEELYEKFPTFFSFLMRTYPERYALDYKQNLKWSDFLEKREISKFEKKMKNPEIRNVFPLCEEEDICIKTPKACYFFLKNELYTPFCVLWNSMDQYFKISVTSYEEKIRHNLEVLCKDIGIIETNQIQKIKAKLPTNDVFYQGMEW